MLICDLRYNDVCVYRVIVELRGLSKEILVIIMIIDFWVCFIVII